MSDIERLIRRVDALEMRTAHQDRTIEDLNAALTAQWKEIDGLKRQVDRLGEQVEEVRDAAAGGDAPEPPPPHY